MIKVLKTGLLTTIQDKGRFGYQKQGIIASGVMDPIAQRIANLLVGNNEYEAVLEMTLAGPKLEFQSDALIAISGGDLSPSINGKAVKQWRPVYVKEGSVLTFGQAKKGCRAYLAIAGSIDVPIVMGSKSTYLRAGIGGFEGRGLQSEDLLSTGSPSDIAQERVAELAKEANGNAFLEMDWYVASDFAPNFNEQQEVRVIKGREYEWFSAKSKEDFLTSSYTISTQSDRMGYRLEGTSLYRDNEASLLSEAVAFGTIQVPSNGQPIILLADRQTTGGYPKIAQIASVDLPIIGQIKPGSTIRFTEISLDEAQELYLQREKKIQELIQGIQLKTKSR